MASAHHELPISTKAAKPTPKAAMVRGIIRA